MNLMACAEGNGNLEVDAERIVVTAGEVCMTVFLEHLVEAGDGLLVYVEFVSGTLHGALNGVTTHTVVCVYWQ